MVLESFRKSMKKFYEVRKEKTEDTKIEDDRRVPKRLEFKRA